MRADIKERIEMICRGDVPEGYKKTDKGMIPIDWEVVALGQYVNVFRGASPRPKGDPQYYGGNIPRVLIEDLTRDGKVTYPCLDSLTELGAKKSRYLKKGSIIMSCSGTKVGITGFLGVDACIHDGFFGFNGFINLNKDYLYYVLTYETELLQSSATKGGVFNNLTTDIMKKLRILLPPINEQINIKNILEKYDDQIKLQKNLIIEKEKQKNWIMQNLFTAKKRVRDFERDWKKIKIKKFIKELNEKTTENNQYEILSVTKDGIFKQSEHFNKQIASEDNCGYKVIRRNNLVFSTMNLWMGSLDVLKKYDVGIVSPAYKIFEFDKQYMIPEFGEYFMKSDYMIWTYGMNSEQGASIVRRNLDIDGLLNTLVRVPVIEEQMEIFQILSQADKEIELLQQRLESIKLEKKAMMQLLLTGIVRVNQKGGE